MKITVQELKNIIDTRPKKKKYLVDVRTLSEYLNCRIKGASFIPLQHFNNSRVIMLKNRDIYVISFNGRRAEEFSRKLDALGYRSFYVEGGLAAWYKSGFPVEQLSEQSCFNKNLHPVFNIQLRIGGIPALMWYIEIIIGAAYFFEKLGTNVKFLYDKDFSFFENSTVIVSEEHRSEEFMDFPYGRLRTPIFHLYRKHYTWDFAHKVISSLSINQNLRKQADEWCAENLKGDWIGVHYRSTDLHRRPGHIGIDTYIACLKERVDKHCNIFACSDQAQFIDRIHKAFPGRVFSRDIPRSYDRRALHLDPAYQGRRQKEDALIDILILAKAARIYKTVGRFSLLAKFLNPSVEIIQLKPSWSGYIIDLPPFLGPQLG